MQKHLCPACEKRFVLAGRYVLCVPCRELRREIKARWLSDPTNRERQRSDTRQRKAQAKAEGICVHCLKRKARAQKVTCEHCRIQMANRYLRRRRVDYVPNQRRKDYV